MKNIFTFVCFACGCVFIGGCASAGFPDIPMSQLTLDNQAIYKCVSDKDCVSVVKDCCLCDGKTAINKKYAKAFDKSKAERCAFETCPMQMCYVELAPSCINGKCGGRLIKPDGPLAF